MTRRTGRLPFSAQRGKLPLYTQITAAERYTSARLRQQGYPIATIARLLDHHRRTLHREVRRNATHHDGGYRSELADSYARTRRSCSRRKQRFSPVERQTGYLVLGQLPARTMAAVNHRATRLLRHQPRPVHTLTCDNGTEFHGHAKLEAATNIRGYFATPHHAWERGITETTTGLVRQYLPQRTSLAHLTQRDCTASARALNQRPRKRLG